MCSISQMGFWSDRTDQHLVGGNRGTAGGCLTGDWSGSSSLAVLLNSVCQVSHAALNPLTYRTRHLPVDVSGKTSFISQLFKTVPAGRWIMSRLSKFAATISTIAVLVTMQRPAIGEELLAPAVDEQAAVVRIVSHSKQSQQAPGLIPETTEAKPIHAISTSTSVPVHTVARQRNHHPNQLGPVQIAPVAMGYPQLNAPLYPSPQPRTPPYVGGTAITNQAFAPHEMLYPHQYKAMYGPYYYQVHGRWYLTPKGVRSHDTWKLQGTEVSVKYRSHYRPFSFFFPPATR